MSKPAAGFSLVELMVVVAVIGLLAAIGYPTLTDFIKQGRMTASVNDLLGASMAAHVEAIKRRAPVTFCRSANATAAAPTCDAAAGKGWEEGWIAFADINGDGNVDNTDQIVTRHDKMGGTIKVVADTALKDAMQFAPGGSLRGLDGVALTGSLLLCDDRGSQEITSNVAASRAVLFTRTGRARIFRELDYITALDIACP